MDVISQEGQFFMELFKYIPINSVKNWQKKTLSFNSNKNLGLATSKKSVTTFFRNLFGSYNKLRIHKFSLISAGFFAY